MSKLDIPVWSHYDKPEKIDNRWSIIKHSKPVNGWRRGYSSDDVYGLPRTKTWYNVIDTTTGYIINVLPKPMIKPFIKLFDSMEYTASFTSIEGYDVPVCVYTSACGKFKIRSWTQYKENSNA